MHFSHSPAEKTFKNVIFNTGCSNLRPGNKHKNPAVNPDLCLGGRSFLLLVGLLLARVRGHSGHRLLWLHGLHHLLLWFLGDGRQRLLLLRGQGERLQVIATRFGLQVGVVEQETLLLLELGDFAVHAHRTEPAPGQRGRVFETLEDVPGRNLLFGGYLEALMEERQKSYTPWLDWLNKSY